MAAATARSVPMRPVARNTICNPIRNIAAAARMRAHRARCARAARAKISARRRRRSASRPMAARPARTRRPTSNIAARAPTLAPRPTEDRAPEPETRTRASRCPTADSTRGTAGRSRRRRAMQADADSNARAETCAAMVCVGIRKIPTTTAGAAPRRVNRRSGARRATAVRKDPTTATARARRCSPTKTTAAAAATFVHRTRLHA